MKRDDALYEEIDIVGLPDDVTLTELLVLHAGRVQAHTCCAVASRLDALAVQPSAQLAHTDAVVAAWTTLCAVCDQYGANLPCAHAACTDAFHYPCALAVGYVCMPQMMFYCHNHVPNGTIRK